MRTIKLFGDKGVKLFDEKGELILEGRIKDEKVNALMDIIWDTRYAAVLWKHEDDDEM